MMNNKLNTPQNYYALYRYGVYIDSEEQHLGTMELIDSREIADNFSKQLIQKYGQKFRDEIFDYQDVPEMGVNPNKKSILTKK